MTFIKTILFVYSLMLAYQAARDSKLNNTMSSFVLKLPDSQKMYVVFIRLVAIAFFTLPTYIPPKVTHAYYVILDTSIFNKLTYPYVFMLYTSYEGYIKKKNKFSRLDILLYNRRKYCFQYNFIIQYNYYKSYKLNLKP